MARDSLAQRHLALAAIAPAYNSGYGRFFSGTQPATADAALSGNTLLAEVRFAATAFGAPSAGEIVANAITQDSAADAAGIPTFFRAYASDGVTALSDHAVGKTGGSEECLINTTDGSGNPYIAAGGAVQVTSFKRTFPVGAS